VVAVAAAVVALVGAAVSTSAVVAGLVGAAAGGAVARERDRLVVPLVVGVLQRVEQGRAGRVVVFLLDQFAWPISSHR